jgi:hypothetical protein
MNVCVSAGMSCHSQQKDCQTSDEYHQHLRKTLEIIRTELEEKVKFYHYVSFELYENGTIKKITIGTDWTIVLTLGIVGGLVGGTAVYLIGPAHIVTALKPLLQHIGPALKIAAKVTI